MRPASSAYALPVGTPRIPAPIALYTPVCREGIPLEKLMLQEGDVWEGAFALVYRGTIDPKAFTLDYAKKALEATAAYWREVRPFQNAFHIPEPQIQGSWTRADGISYRRGNRGGYLRVPCSPTIYRGLWVVDGYYFGECAYMMGRMKRAFSACRRCSSG